MAHAQFVFAHGKDHNNRKGAIQFVSLAEHNLCVSVHSCYPTANSSHDERAVCECRVVTTFYLTAMRMKFQLIATAFLVALSSITLLPQSAVSQQFNPENIVLTGNYIRS